MAGVAGDQGVVDAVAAGFGDEPGSQAVAGVRSGILSAGCR